MKIKYYLLLIIIFITISCKDQHSLIESFGRDVRKIEDEFKKGYNSVDTINNSGYHKIIIFESYDGIHYFCLDTIDCGKNKIIISE